MFDHELDRRVKFGSLKRWSRGSVIIFEAVNDRVGDAKKNEDAVSAEKCCNNDLGWAGHG